MEYFKNNFISINLGFLLSADPNIMDLLQGELLQYFGWNGAGVWKKELLYCNISETQQGRTKLTIEDQ